MKKWAAHCSVYEERAGYIIQSYDRGFEVGASAKHVAFSRACKHYESLLKAMPIKLHLKKSSGTMVIKIREVKDGQ